MEQHSFLTALTTESATTAEVRGLLGDGAASTSIRSFPACPSAELRKSEEEEEDGGRKEEERRRKKERRRRRRKKEGLTESQLH